MKSEEFKIIINNYERLVFNICYQLIRDYQQAENLTQDTFISAFTHIDNYKSENYKPWIARIATNKAKDYLKSSYFKKVHLNGDDDKIGNIVCLDPLPDESCIILEGVKNIEEKINSLKEPYLKVSVLYFLEEKTTEDIATILNRPKKTVQTQLARAKGILQKKLEEEK